jgi:mannitol-1-phosphate 5-dehydrogenase
MIFGAGCIGRGLLGELAANAGWRIVFVESNGETAARLVEAKGYLVKLVGRCPSVTQVTDYTVLTPHPAEHTVRAVQSCAMAATAVGGEHLPEVAELIAPALSARRAPLNILVCENWPHADQVLSDTLSDRGVPTDRFSCVPCSVERMVRSDPASLDLCAESCESVYVDVSHWKGAKPGIAGLNECEDVAPFYARKLFTNNSGHSVLAYEGFLAGHELLCEAMRDDGIQARLRALLTPATEMLCREYAMERKELAVHVECLIRHRFANSGLADRVERVARQPLRKLGPSERLVGLLRLLQRHKLPLQPICRTIAAALHYDHPDDTECARMKQIISKGGPGQVLSEICDIRPEEDCYRLCMQEWEQIETRQ